MKYILTIAGSALFLLLFSITPAFAHVVVKPNQVGIGSFQTCTLGVPNEKDNPTIALRLVLPQGLKHVSPNVKPGWNIEIKKSGENVNEILWTNGSIPVGQRDDFLFSAQVPTNETTINWKAYQTYENGDIIAWDLAPSEEEKDNDDAKNGPYSQTTIINDLKKEDAQNKPNLSLQLSAAALIVALAALGLQLRKK